MAWFDCTKDLNTELTIPAAKEEQPYVNAKLITFSPILLIALATAHAHFQKQNASFTSHGQEKMRRKPNLTSDSDANFPIQLCNMILMAAANFIP